MSRPAVPFGRRAAHCPGPRLPTGAHPHLPRPVEPLGGSYPTTGWAVGERIVEWRVPNKPLPPGTYRVRVGWYDRLSGERLPLPNAVDSAFELGAVEIPR